MSVLRDGCHILKLFHHQREYYLFTASKNGHFRVIQILFDRHRKFNNLIREIELRILITQIKKAKEHSTSDFTVDGRASIEQKIDDYRPFQSNHFLKLNSGSLEGTGNIIFFSLRYLYE